MFGFGKKSSLPKRDSFTTSPPPTTNPQSAITPPSSNLTPKSSIPPTSPDSFSSPYSQIPVSHSDSLDTLNTTTTNTTNADSGQSMDGRSVRVKSKSRTTSSPRTSPNRKVRIKRSASYGNNSSSSARRVPRAGTKGVATSSQQHDGLRSPARQDAEKWSRTLVWWRTTFALLQAAEGALTRHEKKPS
ncbi:hypothetical protein TrLO_g9436 [Triparma laevis f. longispina]|uniref:Uncharacterized protein n=1 Tax=Triparma laevis f. longispina TaxID=1714387 RepID=A0A9W7DPU2_9STRA|nr:hypothetical protein TrLO_g9436 [Triparma laevis f. longispina]